MMSSKWTSDERKIHVQSSQMKNFGRKTDAPTIVERTVSLCFCTSNSHPVVSVVPLFSLWHLLGFASLDGNLLDSVRGDVTMNSTHTKKVVEGVFVRNNFDRHLP